jgi:hypothetical protein
MRGRCILAAGNNMAGGSLDLRYLDVGLEKLIAALGRIGEDEVFDSKPMCDLVQTGWVTLRALINSTPEFEASGVVVRGKEGVAWQFRAKAMVRMLIVDRACRMVAEKRKARAAVKDAGAETIIEPGAANSIKHAKDILDLNRAVRSEEVEQGRLISAKQSEEDFREWNLTAQSAILESAQHADPNNLWPVEVREQWEHSSGNILIALEHVYLKRINLRHGGTPQPRQS